MATVPNITQIPATECIGNSLVSINTNYDNIKNSFTDFNTDLSVLNSQLTNLTTIVNSISSAQLAKAWVKFSATLAPIGQQPTSTFRRILNNYNVSTVIRNSTGDFTINLSAPLAGEFLVTGLTSPLPGSTGTGTGVINLHPSIPFPDSQSCRIVIRDLLGNSINPPIVMLTFFNN